MNISKLSTDNRFLAEENQKAQEGLRTSSVTLQKLTSENAELRRQIELKDREIRNYQQRVSEAEGVGKSVGGLNERINKLAFENQHLAVEARDAQEKLRESSLQSTRLVN